MKFLKFKYKGQVKYCPAENTEKLISTMRTYYLLGINNVEVVQVETYEEVKHGLVQMLTDDEYNRLNSNA